MSKPKSSEKLRIINKSQQPAAIVKNKNVSQAVNSNPNTIKKALTQQTNNSNGYNSSNSTRHSTPLQQQRRFEFHPTSKPNANSKSSANYDSNAKQNANSNRFNSQKPSNANSCNEPKPDMTELIQVI